MSVISLIVILLVLGAIGWLINTKVPCTAWIKMLINIVLVVTAVILVLYAFGIWQEVRNVQVPKL